MNFHYCERLIYFENVLRIPQATTIKELKGRKTHQVFTKTSKRNKIVREGNSKKLPKKYNLHLESKRLHFRTILDCMIIDEEKNQAFPLQYKDMKKPEKVYKTLKMQIFAEILLLKENFDYGVPFGFIKFRQTGELVKINASDSGLKEAEESIYRINDIIEHELLPEPTEFQKRCVDCGYWKICRRT